MQSPEIFFELIGEHQLKPYLNATGGDKLRAMELYEWNLSVAKEYWPAIHIVEISVRNRIARVLFPNGVVEQSQLKTLRLFRYQMSIPKKRVVDFEFGFWVHLLDGKNNNQIWTPLVHCEFQPGTRRAQLHKDLVFIKEFRNKVAHHNQVWNQDFIELNATIERVLGAIAPEALEWVNALSWHHDIHTRRPQGH